MIPSRIIYKQIAELRDWRGEMIARLRKIIHDTDPEMTEEGEMEHFGVVPQWTGEQCLIHPLKRYLDI
jgi:hypothetical protein